MARLTVQHAEPESASLMTNVRFLTDSGKRFHRDRISR